MDERELIAQIEAAWAAVPYPGDAQIVAPDCLDDEGIRDYFRVTSWRGHTVDELRAHSAALSAFFTPAAWHYWLPAYLLAAVEPPRELS